MKEYPKVFTLVRHGIQEPVVVRDRESHLALRTELELLFRFSQHAGREYVDALKTRWSQLEGRQFLGCASLREDIDDMFTIICDGLEPRNRQMRAQMDRAFPDIAREIEVDRIEHEAAQFRLEVAKQIRESNVEGADTMSDAFAEGKDDKVEANTSELDELDAILAEAVGEVEQGETVASAGAPTKGRTPAATPSSDTSATPAQPAELDAAPTPAAERASQSSDTTKPASADAVSDASLPDEWNEADLDDLNAQLTEALGEDAAPVASAPLNLDEALSAEDSADAADNATADDATEDVPAPSEPVEAEATAPNEAAELLDEWDNLVNEVDDTAEAIASAAKEVEALEDEVLPEVIGGADGPPVDDDVTASPTDQAEAKADAEGQPAGTQEDVLAEAVEDTQAAATDDADTLAQESEDASPALDEPVSAESSTAPAAEGSFQDVEPHAPELPADADDATAPESEPEFTDSPETIEPVASEPAAHEDAAGDPVADEPAADETVAAEADTPLPDPAALSPATAETEDVLDATFDQVRGQLESAMNSLRDALYQVNHVRQEAVSRVNQARKFKQVADRALDTGRKFSQAHLEASKARSAYEDAQLQAEALRQAWEDAQRAAGEAADLLS